MKRLVILSLSILCLASATSFAQNYSKAISANPIGLAFDLLNATYENKTSPNNSFTITGNYWSISDWTAFGIGGSYRWYFDINDGKRPIQGMFAGPKVSVGFFSWGGESYYNYSSQTWVGIGGEFGYKWVWDGFMLEPSLNLLFGVGKVEHFTVGAFGAGLSLGYAW
jgi:hypothetical protein